VITATAPSSRTWLACHDRMDVIEEHARRLPDPDERWTNPQGSLDDLAAALIEGEVAGVASHDLRNVRNNVSALIAQDPDKLFGLRGLPGRFGSQDILGLIAEAAGSPIDERATDGEVMIEPAPILEACVLAGERLARAAAAGEGVLIATGHPVGLGLLYLQVARLLEGNGARLLTPADRAELDGFYEGWSIRYNEGVGMVTDYRSALHTHDPGPMRRMLSQVGPDLVVADHGFAGAAIEMGVPTIGIADVNDPALIVAKAQGRTDIVIVMDDNVSPEAYWPCFRAMTAPFARHGFTP